MALIISYSLKTLKSLSSTYSYLLSSWFKHPTEYFDLAYHISNPSCPNLNDSSTSSPLSCCTFCFLCKWVTPPSPPSSLIHKLGSYPAYLIYPFAYLFFKKSCSMNYNIKLSCSYNSIYYKFYQILALYQSFSFCFKRRLFIWLYSSFMKWPPQSV